MKTLTEKRFFEWHEDDTAVTLRNKGGSYGGIGSPRHLLYQDTVGALCQDDYKGPNRQYVEQDKLIVIYETIDRHDSRPSDSEN